LRLVNVASGSTSISRTRAEGDAEILRFMCCPTSSADSHTHCSGSQMTPVLAITIPFAFQSPPSEEMTPGKLQETTRFRSQPEQTSRRADTAQGVSKRNGNRETGRGKGAQAYPTLLNLGPKRSCAEQGRVCTEGPQGDEKKVDTENIALSVLRRR
jgi:hypothetical protein